MTVAFFIHTVLLNDELCLNYYSVNYDHTFSEPPAVSITDLGLENAEQLSDAVNFFT